MVWLDLMIVQLKEWIKSRSVGKWNCKGSPRIIAESLIYLWCQIKSKCLIYDVAGFTAELDLFVMPD